jgi:DNA-directed RNA polymerase subunit M/transcription elongation factor TFIIS
MEQTALVQICEMVHKKKWNCNESNIRGWVAKLVRQINDVFQLNEVIHFVTEEQINNNVIVLNPDRAMIAVLFKNIMNVSQKFQDPNVTFGKDLKNTQCPKCKGFNTLSVQAQTRAIDEPGRWDYECLDPCRHRWTLK